MARLNQNIVIPDNTKLVTSHEFSDSDIISVHFGQSIEISADYIFARCHHILEVEIPSGTILSADPLTHPSDFTTLVSIPV